MANVVISRLWKLREDITHEERVIAIVAGIVPDSLYWLESSRRSSLGGYIGNLRETYRHARGISPSGKSIDNLPLRYLENVTE